MKTFIVPNPFPCLIHPLTSHREIPPVAEYFLLKHGGWPATVPHHRGPMTRQLDHSHAVPAARQLHDPQGRAGQARLRQQPQSRLALTGPVPEWRTAGEGARRALRALHPGQHPAGRWPARPDGTDYRRDHPVEHEPERQRCHAVRDEPLGLLAARQRPVM